MIMRRLFTPDRAFLALVALLLALWAAFPPAQPAAPVPAAASESRP